MSVITHCSEEVAQVVAYEIAAFDRLAGRLRLSCKESGSFIPEEITLVGTGHTDENKWELSTEIESLLVHTRVLRDFFYYFWDYFFLRFFGFFFHFLLVFKLIFKVLSSKK